MLELIKNLVLPFKTALLVGLFLWPSTVTRADEPAEAFLDALRTEGYFDVAIDYLDTARTNPNVSNDFKDSIDYELAQTLILSVRQIRDIDTINSRLNQAQSLLDRYASNRNASVKTRAKTLQYSGVLYNSRADLLFNKSQSDRLTAGERKELMVEARGFLEKAEASISQAKDLVGRLLDPNSPDAIRIDPDDPSTLKEQRLMRETYTRVIVLLPEVTERLADTYEADNPKRKEYLTNAIEQYMKVWENYRQRYAAGIQACVYAGRCRQKLGQHKLALERFSDVFALGSGGSLKRIKKDAYVLATDSWDKITPYPHKDVIFILDPVVRGLTRVEQREPDWLKVQMALAIAKRARSVEIKAAGGPESAANSKTMERAAAKMLRNVARVPSEYRDQAKQLMSQWNVPLSDSEEEVAEIKSFDDALQVGRDRIAELESIAVEVVGLRSKISSENEVDAKQELESQLNDSQAELVEKSQTALNALDASLGFADSETPITEINTVRFLKSFVYFAASKFHESATIGDFLLEAYPNDNVSKQASNYLIQSLSKLLDDATNRGQDGAFEMAELTRVCNEILDRFPGSNEAGLAASTMSRAALKEKNYAQAKEYFSKIPSDYDGRGRIGLRIGQLMWLEYKTELAAGKDPASLKENLENAVQNMKAGVTSITPDAVSYDTAVGALMLVDAMLANGEVKDAVNYLESTAGSNLNATSIAPLDLLKMQHPAVSEGPDAALFRQEAYKVAIKTYLEAMQRDEDRQKWVDKSMGILLDMKRMASNSIDPDDVSRITAIYQLVAAELRKGFDAIDKPAEKLKYAKTLEVFLTSIEEDSTDSKIVLWAGSTMYTVAEALESNGNKGDAAPMMSKALALLDKADKLGFANEKDADSLILRLQHDRAMAYRGKGDYERSKDLFIEMIKNHRVPITYQIEAAQVLQEWGIEEKNKDALAMASGGAGEIIDPKSKRKSRAILGWVAIRTMALQDKQKYRDIFYRALYGVVEGRFEYGKITQSSKAIASAGKEIEKEREKDPTFGGSEEWKQKFAKLEAAINAAK